MPISTLLGRIDGLATQLDPLGGKRRGMRIEADEWNALVDVVAGLIRIERDEEESLHAELADEFAPKAHQHVGEIGIDSLDSELQSRLAADGGGVSTRIALADLQARVEALAGDLGRATAATEDLTRRLDRSSASDVEQSAKLRQLDDRFSGIADLRGVVTSLTTQVAGLHDGVQAVLDLRQSLGGVDVAGLANRVSTLEALGKNFEGVDGDPVHLKDVEVQIRELQDTLDLKPGSGLDDRINALRDQLSGDLDRKVNDALETTRTTLEGEIADARSSLSSELDSKLEGARSDVASMLDARIAEASSALDASLASRVDAAAADLHSTLTSETTQLVDGRLADLPALAQTAATNAVTAATPGIRDGLLSTLGSTIDQRFADVSAQLDARVSAIDATVAAQGDRLPSLVSDAAAELLPGLVDQRVGAAADTLAASLGARVDQQLAQARDALSSGVQEQVTSSVAAALGDVDARVASQLDARLAGLDERISTAAAEAVADLPQLVSTEVQTQLGALELDQRFDQVSAQLTSSFQDAVAKAVSDVQEQEKTNLAAAVETLRGDIVTARDAALNEAIDRIEAASGELKDAISAEASRADNALNTTATTLRDEFDTRIVAAVGDLQTKLTASIDGAVQTLDSQIAGIRDSITADFEAELEKTQETLIARIDSTARTTLTSAQTLVTNLQKAITPRLDTLETTVRRISPTAPNIGTHITPINPGG